MVYPDRVFAFTGDNLLEGVAKLEERISPILVNRLDDSGEDKDASLGPRRSSFRIALDDETDKVKRLENIICKLIKHFMNYSMSI